MIGIDVIVRPVDGGRFAVTFATGIKFESVLSGVAQAFELAGLLGKCGYEMPVGDVEIESLTVDFKIALVAGQFCLGIVEKQEIVAVALGRYVGEEHNAGKHAIAAPTEVVDLGAYLLKIARGVFNLCDS